MKALLVLALAATALVGACSRAADSEKSFGARVRTYLLAHPEVIGEAMQRLRAKEAADDAAAQAKAKTLLPSLRGALERDPRDFTANPKGTVTVTEFYDYRCPHCVNAAPKVLTLINQDHDVRFVFKEMPIFGRTSEHAARAALAVKKAGGDYLGAYASLMQTRPLDDKAIDRIAMRFGAHRADLQSSAAADAQMADVADLFKKLDLDGTPAFIVGDEIIAGEDMEALAAAIAKARRASHRTA
jgi:protein-disulfide isomerase